MLVSGSSRLYLVRRYKHDGGLMSDAIREARKGMATYNSIPFRVVRSDSVCDWLASSERFKLCTCASCEGLPTTTCSGELRCKTSIECLLRRAGLENLRRLVMNAPPKLVELLHQDHKERRVGRPTDRNPRLEAPCDHLDDSGKCHVSERMFADILRCLNQVSTRQCGERLVSSELVR